MRKNEVEIGKVYIVRVSGRIARVKITGESPYGGWDGKNLETGREVRIRTAGRLRGEDGARQDERFPHTVIEVTPESEQVVGRFTASKAFAGAALWKFHDYSAAIGCHWPVMDSSLAGRHYRNHDGTRVTELR